MGGREGAGNLVYAQSSKGQRFAALCVDQQDFCVQDHTVTSRERLRDVVLKVRHLENIITGLESGENTQSCFQSCPESCLAAAILDHQSERAGFNLSGGGFISAV